MPSAGYEPGDVAPSRGSRSFARQAVVDTLARPSAWFGLVWIGVLVLTSVFAPFIANSFPLFVKQQGHWSSPMLRYLTPADVTWLVAFITVLVLAALRKVAFLTGLAIVLWMVALTLPLTLWPAVIKDGWLPGAEAMGRGTGWAILVTICLGAAAILIGVLLTIRPPKLIIWGLGIFAAVVLLLLICCPIDPPQAIVYEEFRNKEVAGSIESIIRTPIAFSPNDYQRDDHNACLQPPSTKHLMGTEQSGADVFSRMIHASRIALSIGFIATGISVIIGVIIGGLMGYFSGTVDILGMRLIEIFEAIPVLILLLTVCAFFGRNLYLMMLIIGVLSWTGNARFIRAEFLRLRNQDFVQAALAAGLPLRSVIFKHMLPNGITPVLVNTSFGVASAILIESTLSFLGLGLVDEPSWGQLLNQARAGGTGFQWWIATFPGLAIFLTVFSYNLIGEAIRDAIDPRLRKRD